MTYAKPRPTRRPNPKEQPMTSTATDCPRFAHARRQLTLAGLLAKDPAYGRILR